MPVITILKQTNNFVVKSGGENPLHHTATLEFDCQVKMGILDFIKAMLPGVQQDMRTELNLRLDKIIRETAGVFSKLIREAAKTKSEKQG